VAALRHLLPAGARLMAADGFYVVPWLVRLTGPAAEGMTISRPGLPLDRLPAAGARFVASLGARVGERPDPYSVYAAQAADVLLDAIARSDGTRASVTKQLFRTRIQRGILGDFGFDANGDTTSAPVTILRAERSGGSAALLSSEGADIVEVIRPPES
jgi:branched-chain amino acid transport system substrate-binding protein